MNCSHFYIFIALVMSRFLNFSLFCLYVCLFKVIYIQFSTCEIRIDVFPLQNTACVSSLFSASQFSFYPFSFVKISQFSSFILSSFDRKTNYSQITLYCLPSFNSLNLKFKQFVFFEFLATKISF